MHTADPPTRHHILSKSSMKRLAHSCSTCLHLGAGGGQRAKNKHVATSSDPCHTMSPWSCAARRCHAMRWSSGKLMLVLGGSGAGWEKRRQATSGQQQLRQQGRDAYRRSLLKRSPVMSSAPPHSRIVLQQGEAHERRDAKNTHFARFFRPQNAAVLPSCARTPGELCSVALPKPSGRAGSPLVHWSTSRPISNCERISSFASFSAFSNALCTLRMRFHSSAMRGAPHNFTAPVRALRDCTSGRAAGTRPGRYSYDAEPTWRFCPASRASVQGL